MTNVEIQCMIRYPFRQARKGYLQAAPGQATRLRVEGDEGWRTVAQLPERTVLELDHLDPQLDYFALRALADGWTLQWSGRARAGHPLH
ncbi:MAG: hypothetical protein M3Q65_05260 [Chloroflexota bacterium]|nr:hypothetical protein [Chloroflexota bacterium]